MVFAQLEPFGERRADLRAAIVATTVANANRGKNQRPFKVEDFMPRLDADEDVEPDWQRLLEQVRGVNAAVGGEDHTQ